MYTRDDFSVTTVNIYVGDTDANGPYSLSNTLCYSGMIDGVMECDATGRYIIWDLVSGSSFWVSEAFAFGYENLAPTVSNVAFTGLSTVSDISVAFGPALASYTACIQFTDDGSGTYSIEFEPEHPGIVDHFFVDIARDKEICMSTTCTVQLTAIAHDNSEVACDTVTIYRNSYNSGSCSGSPAAVRIRLTLVGKTDELCHVAILGTRCPESPVSFEYTSINPTTALFDVAIPQTVSLMAPIITIVEPSRCFTLDSFTITD